MPDDQRKFTGPHMIRALAHRNFQLFYSGQFVSLIGTWMQQVAVGWLTYQLTNSAFLLGLISFANQSPSFLLTPLAGALVDRSNRHKLVVTTQILSMLQSFVLAALTLSGQINIWELVALGALLGMVNAVDIPARQAFMVEIVDNKEDLGNAIALNSSMFNLARLIGPSIGGLLIASVGMGMCFIFNGLSYIAVIGALLAMRLRPNVRPKPEGHILGHLREGIIYSFSFGPIRGIILLLAFISLVAMPFNVFLPVFAKDILHGNATTLGWLTGAIGLGAVFGAMSLTHKRGVLGLGRWIVSAAVVFGAGLIGFAVSPNIWFALGALFVAGFGMMMLTAASNTVLQTLVHEDKRGRVMSLYALAILGMGPLGALFAGAIASYVGVPQTVLAGGVLTCVAGLVFASQLPKLREQARPIYIEKGIITPNS